MATVLKDPLEREMLALGEAARAAAAVLALAPRATKDAALLAAAAALREGEAAILAANARDMAAARAKGLSGAMLDRLELNPKRVAGMAEGLETVAALDDPGRHRARPLDAAQRPRHRPGAGAAGRGRDHLREPAQRHRRCRGAVPQVRQRRDPARRLGELPLLARDRRRPRRRAAPRPACPRPRSSWCRPPTAPPSAICCAWPSMST